VSHIVRAVGGGCFAAVVPGAAFLVLRNQENPEAS
jgi:hypothetical protein